MKVYPSFESSPHNRIIVSAVFSNILLHTYIVHGCFIGYFIFFCLSIVELLCFITLVLTAFHNLCSAISFLVVSSLQFLWHFMLRGNQSILKFNVAQEKSPLLCRQSSKQDVVWLKWISKKLSAAPFQPLSCFQKRKCTSLRMWFSIGALIENDLKKNFYLSGASKNYERPHWL